MFFSRDGFIVDGVFNIFRGVVCEDVSWLKNGDLMVRCRSVFF